MDLGGSATISPTHSRGFRLECGSWNTIWTFRRTGAARGRPLGDVAPADTRSRPRSALQGGEQPGQGRLPAAGLADDAERLALAQGQIDPVDGATSVLVPKLSAGLMP